MASKERDFIPQDVVADAANVFREPSDEREIDPVSFELVQDGLFEIYRLLAKEAGIDFDSLSPDRQARLALAFHTRISAGLSQRQLEVESNVFAGAGPVQEISEEPKQSGANQWTILGPFDEIRDRMTPEAILYRVAKVLNTDLIKNTVIRYGTGSSITYVGIKPKINRGDMNEVAILRSLDTMGLRPECLTRLNDSKFKKGPSLRERMLMHARYLGGEQDDLSMSFMRGIGKFLYGENVTKERLLKKGVVGVIEDLDKITRRTNQVTHR